MPDEKIEEYQVCPSNSPRHHPFDRQGDPGTSFCSLRGGHEGNHQCCCGFEWEA